MLGLSDHQLQIVMTAANRLPAEKRGVFLERVIARLGLHARFTAAEFDKAIQIALQGLIHERTTA
jgi:hypothetical protein